MAARHMGQFMFSQCKLFCPVCKAEFDWMKKYGREIGCCGKACHDEAEWRYTLAIMGKEYYPDPRKKDEQEQ
jgi:hypothetical protein